MKALLTTYKLLLWFIITFLAVYTVLTIAYNFYLNVLSGSQYYPDYMTNLVGNQTSSLLKGMGCKGKVLPHAKEPSMKIMINGKFVASAI